MIFTTKALSPFGQPEFEIQLNQHEFAQVDFDFLQNALVQMAKSGARFLNGQLIQIGSTPCRVASGRGTLFLEEPDFEMYPLHWIPGATNTMRHLRIQNYVGDSLGLRDSLSHPSVLQSAVICTQLTPASGIFMERTSPTDSEDSGWNILCPDPKHAHDNPATLRRELLYLVCMVNSAVPQYIALPEKISILQHFKGIPHFSLNGEPIPFARDSYLAQRYVSIRPR
ncbi:MAG: hypothetical protein JNM27_16155 [Leptospirales bacterium]|nr:hypothetical protein [Leptospirales bacterium]